MKKMLSMVLAGVMLTSSLAACSVSAEETERTKVVMWGSWSGDQIDQLNEMIDKYNASQDVYAVEYVLQDALEEKLLTGIAGGELPDVLMWDRYNTGIYADKGALMSLDELVERDGVDLSVFYEAAVDEATGADGSLYGIPLYVDVRVLFYNKTMFEEAGIDPDGIETWDDLEAAAIQLTKWDGDTLTQAGFSLKDCGLFNIWITQAGGELVDTSTDPAVTAFNSEEGLMVLNFWDKLMNEDKVYTLGFEDGYGGDGFAAGVVAITYNGPWALTDYDNAGIDYGVIANPVGPDGDQGAFMGGFSLAIPNGAGNEEGAWDFIKWWTTQPENQVEFSQISGWMPANLEAAEDSYFTENEYFSVFTEVLSYADIRPKTLGYSDVEGLALIPQLQKFMSGEISAEEALETAQRQGDQIFADYAE